MLVNGIEAAFDLLQCFHIIIFFPAVATNQRRHVINNHQQTISLVDVLSRYVFELFIAAKTAFIIHGLLRLNGVLNLGGVGI